MKRQNQKKAMKKRAKKGRSMSESYCDELKVINELDSLENNTKKDEKRGGKSNQGRKGAGKQRSMSESSDDDNVGDMQTVKNHLKYKSILKNRNSLSECNDMSSADDSRNHFYSMSADFGICESHDSLSESCKKTVRFSDIIKRQLFRFDIFFFINFLY